MNKTYIIIPCYNPNESFVKFFNELKLQLGKNIQCIVVSDGSDLSKLELVKNTMSNTDFVKLLSYSPNRGKGFAIKVAIKHLLDKYPDSTFNIITADCDGQHLVSDILNFIRLLNCNSSDHLLLGVRKYSGWMPTHSKLGHFLSNNAFKILFKIELEDTHCGLRGFNSTVAQSLLKLPWNRFDFELAMIPYCYQRYELVTEDVQGIYNKEEYSTTYTLRDWWLNLKSLLQIHRYLKRNK